MVIGTCASGGTGTIDWQMAGSVGVAVNVAVMVGVGVIVGVAVTVGVWAGAQPLAPQASQQLVNTPAQALPPDGARHFETSDLTLHFTRPLAVVRQQVTAPGLRPQVDFAVEAQVLGSALPLTAAVITLLAQRM
jgi:hypothetical protein